jgi:inosine-uridine nucleoside N-ribohydrolase
MTTNLILDTDIGDDVDDALALALICNSPELNLVGVTTVFRDAPRRAILATEVLRLFGRSDVPVHAGVSRPLVQTWDDIPHGGAQLGRQFEALDPNLKPPSSAHAVDFLAQKIIEYSNRGGKLTIAPIGPLTNIALLFARYPETVAQCNVLLMGGQWGKRSAEWNILCDPEAAAMVFRAGADLTMVGLDVTLRCVLSDDQVAQLRSANTPRATFLADLIELWGHKVTLHDPLTILTLLDSCVTFEPKRIEVGLCGEDRSLTLETEGQSNARVAVDVDAERAVEGFMQRISQ